MLFLQNTVPAHSRQHRKKNGGFTLIELLVVVALIAVLTSIVSASLNSARAKARDTRRVQDMTQVITALELYYDAHQHFPCSSGENSLNGTMLATLVNGGFLSTSPKDPTNKGAYMYFYSTFKEYPTGPCGQVVQLNFDRQWGTTFCPNGGKFITSTHCHFFYPHPVSCSDPYLYNEPGPPDCEALRD